MIYRVRSGELDTNVRAINHKTAAFIAVNRAKGDLGVLIGVLRKGDTDSMEIMFSSAKIMEDMDLIVWSDEEQN